MRRAIILTLAAVLAAGCREPPTPGTVTPSVQRTDRDGRLRPEALARSADQIVEAMGTREARAARAPYSPKWWTLDVGDTITDQRWWELSNLEAWNDRGSVFWLDTLMFLPVYEDAWHDHWGLPQGVVYHGHFPRKNNFGPEWWRDEVPDHLSGESEADIRRWLVDPRDRSTTRPPGADEVAMWTRARWLEGWTGPEAGGNE